MPEQPKSPPERHSPGSAARRLRSKLFLVLASVVVALLLAEAVIRLVPRRWVPELHSYREMAFHLGDLVRPSDQTALYFELAPDNPQAEVNRAGYRGPFYPREKPPRVARIVGLGDSNMFAWQLPEAAGYIRQLEALLNEGEVTPRVQTLNLAVPGYNAGQHLEVLRQRALAFQPDLIILGYDHNDAEPIAMAGQVSYLMPDDFGDNFLGSRLIRWVRRKYRVLQWSWSLQDVDAAGNEKVGPYLASGPLWDEQVHHLEAMAAWVKERPSSLAPEGIPVLVVIHDAWIRADSQQRSAHYEKLHRPLLALFRRLGWHVLDGYDLFQQYMAENRQRDLRDLWVSVQPQDGHPNERAHRLIAEALAKLIVDEKLLPAGRAEE